MKNKRMIFWIALAVTAIIPACTQKYDDEKDFQVTVIDGGKGVEITTYTGNKQTIRIPPRIQKLPVTRIGNGAFSERKGLTNITGVTIPNSVTKISLYAFSGSGLTGVTIPGSVLEIGSDAFACPITSVTFEGMIMSENFNEFNSFPGDLRSKFYAANPSAGIPGTYTTAAPVGIGSRWTNQTYKEQNYSGTWHIVAKNGAAIRVYQGSTDNGDVITTYNGYSGAELQTQWMFDRQDGNTYSFMNVNSNKVIDVPGGSQKAGEVLVQWDPNGGANQRWRIIPVGGGYVAFVSFASGLVMDVPGNNTDNDTPLIQWYSNNGDGQKFKLVPVK